MFILLTKHSSLLFFPHGKGIPWVCFPLLFMKKGGKEDLLTLADQGNDSGMQSSGQGSGDSGEGGPSEGSEEPP